MYNFRPHMQLSKISIIALLIIFTFSACEKYNQVDNSATVKTPYVLYIGGLTGSFHKTNDGKYFDPLFPIDNSPVRQIITADSNLLYLKKNCYVSEDEGKAFNLCNDHARAYYDLFYNYFVPNQMHFDASEKIAYLCTATGLERSTDLGKTFAPVANWAGGPITPISITELDNGDLYIIQDGNTISKLTGGTGNWTAVAQSTTALPSANPAIWYLTHVGDTLVAVDYDGVDGLYYSTDAATWKKYSGVLGNGRNILFANKPYGSANFFIGKDSAGLYRTNGTSFSASGTGLPWFAKVQYVEGKRVVYRTDIAKYYLFCATDVGLYVSESDGDDWRLIRAGNYSTLH